MQRVRQDQGRTPFLNRLQNGILQHKRGLRDSQQKWNGSHMPPDVSNQLHKEWHDMVAGFYRQQMGDDMPTSQPTLDLALDSLVNDVKVRIVAHALHNICTCMLCMHGVHAWCACVHVVHCTDPTKVASS